MRKKRRLYRRVARLVVLTVVFMTLAPAAGAACSMGGHHDAVHCKCSHDTPATHKPETHDSIADGPEVCCVEMTAATHSAIVHSHGGIDCCIVEPDRPDLGEKATAASTQKDVRAAVASVTQTLSPPDDRPDRTLTPGADTAASRTQPLFLLHSALLR